MGIERRKRQVLRAMQDALKGQMRDTWKLLASLPLRERVKLSWWMLIGKKELPVGEK
jgi:hypothetical protein